MRMDALKLEREPPPSVKPSSKLSRESVRREARAEIVEKGYEEAVVDDIVRKVDLNEYKRKQAAPGLKTTPLAFGVGRRIPIVQKYVS